MRLLSALEQPFKSCDGGKRFSDFLVLEFILMRVLKLEKMIGGQNFYCSFLSRDDNIQILGAIVFSVLSFSSIHGFAGIVDWLKCLFFRSAP
ncbi:hypothetical protein Tco_1383765 [Tanacetum coccineum]